MASWEENYKKWWMSNPTELGRRKDTTPSQYRYPTSTQVATTQPSWNDTGEAQRMLGKYNASTTQSPSPSTNSNWVVSPPNGIGEYYTKDGKLMVWNGMDGYIQAGYDAKTDLTVDRSTPGPSYREDALYQKEQERQFQAQQQEQMISWYREQASMQAAQEKQSQLASLLANPMSWIQYNALAETNPAVQPWMQPLMSQQYSGLQAGQAIPGWKEPAIPRMNKSEWGAQSGNEQYSDAYGTNDLSHYDRELLEKYKQQDYEKYLSQLAASQPQPTPRNMPSLTSPSAQYWARMSPTSQSQYLGYQSAQTGAPAETEQWRLQSQAPPSGRKALSWTR